MENYVRANRSAPIYDPYEEEESLNEDMGEADYVIAVSYTHLTLPTIYSV